MINFLVVLDPSWGQLGPNLGPTWNPTWGQLGPQMERKGVQMGFQVHFNTETKVVYFVLAGPIDSSLRAS